MHQPMGVRAFHEWRGYKKAFDAGEQRTSRGIAETGMYLVSLHCTHSEASSTVPVPALLHLSLLAWSTHSGHLVHHVLRITPCNNSHH